MIESPKQTIPPENIPDQDVICDIQNVCTEFDDNIVHHNLNLTVKRGDILALVGRSGCGKTTLLRHIIGLTKPQSGKVLLFGENLHAMERVAQRRLMNRFGVLFQQGALFSALSVFENVAFPLRELKQFDESVIYQLVMHKLTLVELEPRYADLLPAEISGGMVKRVGLARALALEPELLVLDEPTAGLDPDRSHNFIDLVKQLKKSLGLTVLFVTHDMDTLASLAERVAVLEDKHIIADCSLQELARIDHPFVINFFQSIRSRLERL
ncbi:MAG: ATP-binding cassette domain-containing protein [Methylotenera sp.]|jgi:phospholipid/cholesterol/gamma-HCH transport system ATP-binding protein|nr:ATP-binding cassette domain-containing protein [Methylotenera sp.]HPH09225.1 ATP-binding cassette domain-containing protein [Methylotenera sp.]